MKPHSVTIHDVKLTEQQYKEQFCNPEGTCGMLIQVEGRFVACGKAGISQKGGGFLCLEHCDKEGTA
jgi:hypothetical protein